ncbi:hypothetical protein AXA84_0434 [Candidatus Phytoplasma oryzae]|uniref:Uncharacterized protein n=1 Tax=Candidatus Phytoplasma oryzae TaxID=203274 RepID=A0A139JQB5_9MOLU|nr:hypothetical protein [Candidatus Phytoplasma oryzae]KXT29054.1 hypothetical protein AXA84_0434 [Candidatus Phytoplasma oryzae]RAM57658.1 hypothetical protein DH96_02270 [Candidatus Phytoplasma oryzae]
MINFKNDIQNNLINNINSITEINVKIHVRYLKKENGIVKREWFLNNLFFIFNKKKYNFKEIIVIFNHIDEENPEFFLQPEQIIKIIKGKIINKNKQNILLIDQFQQLSEKERNKNINSS